MSQNPEAMGSFHAPPARLLSINPWQQTPKTWNMDVGRRMTYAGLPYRLGFGLEDSHFPDFLASTVFLIGVAWEAYALLPTKKQPTCQAL